MNDFSSVRSHFKLVKVKNHSMTSSLDFWYQPQPLNNQWRVLLSQSNL